MTRERWEEIGSTLSTMHRCIMWVVGDWLLAWESAGYLPRGKLKEACTRFGIAYDTASQAVRVCKAFESCSRLQLLGFNHHQSVAGDDDAAELLTWASDNKATVEELRTEKKRRLYLGLGHSVQDTFPEQIQPVDLTWLTLAVFSSRPSSARASSRRPLPVLRSYSC
jgi:hypothetical protein